MEILTSKCFLFGVSISKTAIIAEKNAKPGDDDCVFFYAIFDAFIPA